MAALSVDERTALRDNLARLLADFCAEGDVRRVMETPEGYDSELWRQLVQMGIAGLLAPEEFGGAGAGAMEVELVMEEMGAALLACPFLSSGVLAVTALNAAGDDDASARWLPKIAAGETIATLAVTGPAGAWTAESVDIRASARDGAWRLDGVADFVTSAQNADVVFVVARDEMAFSLFEIETGAHGLKIAPLPTFDRTLRLGRVSLAQAPARLIGRRGAGWSVAEAALALARVALAGDQAGGAKRIFERTVDYAKTRIQFGRAIGSFQAIKHMAADLLLETETAITAARAAARALAEGAPDAPAAIHLAAFTCADAYVRTAADAIQMHGGIAFTWDHPAHLYLRRARGEAQLFGAPIYHREQFVRQIEA